jgi:serine/threonine protein phosphatase PrpC
LKDAHVILDNFENEQSGLFAVFDGHGGKAAADYVAEKFPEVCRLVDRCA